MSADAEVVAESIATRECPDCHAGIGYPCTRVDGDAPAEEIETAEQQYGHPLLHFDREWTAMKARNPSLVWIFTRPEPQ